MAGPIRQQIRGVARARGGVARPCGRAERRGWKSCIGGACACAPAVLPVGHLCPCSAWVSLTAHPLPVPSILRLPPAPPPTRYTPFPTPLASTLRINLVSPRPRRLAVSSTYFSFPRPCFCSTTAKSLSASPARGCRRHCRWITSHVVNRPLGLSHPLPPKVAHHHHHHHHRYLPLSTSLLVFSPLSVVYLPWPGNCGPNPVSRIRFP